MPLFYQVVSFNHPTKLFNFYVYASALPWLELVWLTSNQPVWLKQKKHEQSQTNSYWESTGRSNMIVHLSYDHSSFTAKIAGPCWVFWTFWANTSSEPITQWDPYYYYSTVTRFAEFCRVRDTKLQTQSPLNLLTCLMSYGALFSRQFHNPKFGFFYCLVVGYCESIWQKHGWFLGCPRHLP